MNIPSSYNSSYQNPSGNFRPASVRSAQTYSGGLDSSRQTPINQTPGYSFSNAGTDYIFQSCHQFGPSTLLFWEEPTKLPVKEHECIKGMKNLHNVSRERKDELILDFEPKHLLGVTISNSERMHRNSYWSDKNRRLFNCVTRLCGEVRMKNYWKICDENCSLNVGDDLFVQFYKIGDKNYLVFHTLFNGFDLQQKELKKGTIRKKKVFYVGKVCSLNYSECFSRDIVILLDPNNKRKEEEERKMRSARARIKMQEKKAKRETDTNARLVPIAPSSKATPLPIAPSSKVSAVADVASVPLPAPVSAKAKPASKKGKKRTVTFATFSEGDDGTLNLADDEAEIGTSSRSKRRTSRKSKKK